MPYKIEKDHSECGKGKYAVVNKGTGEVKGCHMTEAEAKKHMAALYANEPGAKSMTPASLCLRSAIFTRANNNSDDPGDGRTLEGYAAVFETPTRIDSWEGSFDEEIARGAFKRSLRERTPKLQFDHGRDKRTGTVPIGKVEEVKEDEHGLYVRARLFENDVVEPIRQAIEAGAIDGMSFRFQVDDDEWRDNAGKKVKDDELLELLWMPGERGPLKRTIKRASVFELGPVVFPAYDATSVGVRSLLDQVDGEEREALINEVVRRITAVGFVPKQNPVVETTRSEEEGMTEEVHSEETEEPEIRSEETEEPTDPAGQADTRSTAGSDSDEESRTDEASTQEVSAAILKAELEDERRKQERRIRDQKLRKMGIIK